MTSNHDPRPGIVHRPTRSSLPPAEGPDLPHPPNHDGTGTVAIGAPKRGEYLSQARREQTTGSHVPDIHPDDPVARLWHAFELHGHGSHAHTDHDTHVLAIGPDGALTLADGLHPAVISSIHRLAYRVAPELYVYDV